MGFSGILPSQILNQKFLNTELGVKVSFLRTDGNIFDNKTARGAKRPQEAAPQSLSKVLCKHTTTGKQTKKCGRVRTRSGAAVFAKLKFCEVNFMLEVI